MAHDARKLCVICAWRASCAKRFNMGDDATMHCPDFTEDVSLRKKAESDTAQNSEES